MSYKICSRCIMDTTADDIKFDRNNYCNYCSDFLKKYQPNKTKKYSRQKFINSISK